MNVYQSVIDVVTLWLGKWYDIYFACLTFTSFCLLTDWRYLTRVIIQWKLFWFQTRLQRLSHTPNHSSTLRYLHVPIILYVVNVRGAKHYRYPGLFHSSQYFLPGYILNIYLQVWSESKLSKTIDVKSLKRHGTINEDGRACGTH